MQVLILLNSGVKRKSNAKYDLLSGNTYICVNIGVNLEFTQENSE